MKKLAYIFGVIILFDSCQEEDLVNDVKEPISKHTLLADSPSKSWYFYEYPADEECPDEAEYMKDNTLIFYHDGKFEYDNGDITEGAECGDLIDLIGEWSFENNKKELKVTALHKTGDPDHRIDQNFLHGRIDTLAEDRLKITQLDTASDTEYAYYFKPRE